MKMIPLKSQTIKKLTKFYKRKTRNAVPGQLKVYNICNILAWHRPVAKNVARYRDSMQRFVWGKVRQM
jgi:hypothetical protein